MKVVQAKPANYDRAVALAKDKAPDLPVVQLGKYGVRKIWDNYEIIADARTDDRHFIRIAVGTIDGYRYVILREFYLRHGEDTWYPGKNGLRIPIKMPMYPNGATLPTFVDVGDEFLEGFTKAIEAAKTMELANKDNAIYILKNYSRATSIKMKEISSNEDQQP